MAMVYPTAAPTGAPPVVTGNQSGLWQAVSSGMSSNPQAQQALNAQLVVANKKASNRRYISECIRKLAPSLTNGQATQAFAPATPFTFNLPQPNNAFARGIVVRTTLNYTLATGTSAVYGLTAAGNLAIYDNIEVTYNKSQIKIRPLWLRELAQIGALEMPSIPSTAATDAGSTADSALNTYLNPTMPVATGAQTYQQDLWIPFNLLGPLEDRGLLPSMPGETGIQVKLTTASSLFGTHPVFNALYLVSGSGGAVSAVSGTIKVIMIYSDGEVYSQPTALAYDMNVLDGTIQAQTDAQLTKLVTGSQQCNRGALTILGLHQYVGLLCVDGNQSNLYSARSNINYLESAKDSVGANVFWKYGAATNLDVEDYFWQERFRHKNHDISQGAMFFIEAPIIGASTYGSVGGHCDGYQYLDNSTNGWPAWHYGIGLNTVDTLGAGTCFIEPMTIYINKQGLPPV